MAVSRGRKKKKTKSSQSKNAKKQVFNDGAVEFIRKGRNIFIKNIMSSEDHKRYLLQIKENYPKAYEEIIGLIDKLVGLINSYDKVAIIGGIASYGIHLMMTKKSDDTMPETNVEYCQSIASATQNVNKDKLPTNDILKEIYELLCEIRKYFATYYSFEGVTEKYSELESEIRLNMILENLFVRGEGYMTHIIELFKEMFTPHDEMLEKFYGFKSNDILDTFTKLEESFACRVILPNGRPHPFQTFKLDTWRKQNNVSWENMRNGSYLPAFAKDHPEIIYENDTVVLYPLNSIPTYKSLFKIRHFNDTQKRVVETLSIKFGENDVFSQPDKFKYQILNKSNVYLKPILEEDGEYYLFGLNLGIRNIFYIAQNLIKVADANYYNKSFLGNRVEKSKDDFIERKVEALFRKMLPNVDFYRNVNYTFKDDTVDLKCAQSKDGNYEMDILGISEKATYLIEVKAGVISEEAKRGAIQRIKADLSAVIGDAICQSYRANIYIDKTENPEFIIGNKKTVVPINKENIFRISISFSYAGTIITDLSKLQELGIVDTNADFAWTLNIFDLFPFVELIESEDQLIDYLKKRIPLYKDKRLVDADEMDMLGFYFADDLKIHKSHKNTDSLRLSGYHTEIDNYFEEEGEMPLKRKSKR